MVKGLFLLVRRDVARAWRGGELWLPVAFFMLVATLYPFAVGPDARLLARTGGGMVWVAALLAALLPIDRLVRPDAEAGVLDQLAVRGWSDEWVATAKIAAHALGFGVPLLLALLPASALLDLPRDVTAQLALGLAVATPALAALAVTVAALTAHLRASGAVGGLLILPLAVPLLIFGAGMLNPAGAGATKLLIAASLMLTAAGPFAAGAGLRALRD